MYALLTLLVYIKQWLSTRYHVREDGAAVAEEVSLAQMVTGEQSCGFLQWKKYRVEHQHNKSDVTG